MPAPWLVKYDGVCRLCGRPLLKGRPAIWEPRYRAIRCVECPPTDSSMPARDANDGGAHVSDAGPDDDAIPDRDDPDCLPSTDLDTGVAGGSARREYERRRARREERVRGAYGNRLGGLLLTLTSDPQTGRAWARGAWGEEKLADALADLDVLVLHDRRVPGTRGNIDHIAISPAGVFVIDAKAHTGLVRVRDRGGLFRQDLRLYVGRRDCTRLAEGLDWQTEAVAGVLMKAELKPLPPLTAVLCFVDAEWPLLLRPAEFMGVRLEGIRSIRRLLTGDPVLVDDEVQELARLLASRLPAK